MIVNSTNIDPDVIQRNVFFWVEGDPCPQPMQLNISIMEPCKVIGGYDYFEVRYIRVYNCTDPNGLFVGKRVCIHIRLPLPRICPNTLRWCGIRRGQASEPQEEKAQNQTRGTEKW